MFKSKLLTVIASIIILIIIIFGYVYYKHAQSNSYEQNIKSFKVLLKQDPHNCFYMQQIAAYYSFLENFDEAIKYYNEAIKTCPNDNLSIFQLGVCHYIQGNKKTGLQYMNMAIKKAEEFGDKDLALMYEKEKEDLTRSGDKLKMYRSKLESKKHSILNSP